MNRDCTARARVIAWVAVACAGVAGCAREGLGVPDATVAAALDAARDGGPEAAVEAGADAREAPDACEPRAEICNGLDDDCDGRVDDGVEVLRCPNGGESICIAGAYSTCPRRCEVCVPGSERVCFLSYCTVWGRQVCQADGYGWGGCNEKDPPSACADGTFGSRDEPTTGECCLSLGLCCVDRWDSDDDGDTDEAFGACESTSCE